jgi:hypothetical protein
MYVARAAALAAAFGALAFSAQAVSVDLIDTSTQGAGNQAHIFASAYAGYTPAGAVFSDDALVTPPPGSLASLYQSPFNNTALSETQSYFSVGTVDRAGDGAPSPVTLTFGAPIDSFTILWGSIDSYNTIEFFSGAASLMAFTGSQIVDMYDLGGLAGANLSNYEQVALLRFSDFGQGGLTSVKFTSPQAAFEFALAPQPIPLPASALLLFGALGGLGVISRQRKAATA